MASDSRFSLTYISDIQGKRKHMGGKILCATEANVTFPSERSAIVIKYLKTIQS